MRHRPSKPIKVSLSKDVTWSLQLLEEDCEIEIQPFYSLSLFWIRLNFQLHPTEPTLSYLSSLLLLDFFLLYRVVCNLDI